MLGYITAEDVFEGPSPDRRKPGLPPPLPETLTALYDAAMRSHDRPAALLRPAEAGFEALPDWKLDRLVIRIALYCRERLKLEPGERAAIFGRLHWLWPAVDAAAQGFGAIPVGLEHGLGDEALLAALRDAAPRVVFATDAESAARLDGLYARGLLPKTPVVAEGAGPEASGLLPLPELLERAGTLDTAERAQAFRMVARGVRPEAEALWHAAPEGVERLTHARALRAVAARRRMLPPQPGDLAYVEAPRVTLRTRLALASFLGDGLTACALGRETAPAGELGQVRPHGALLGAEGLERTGTVAGPRWPPRRGHRAAGRKLKGLLGDRIRWIETERPLDGAIVAALQGVGVAVATGPE